MRGLTAAAVRAVLSPVSSPRTKIDPVATGTYALPNGSVDIMVYDTPAGQEFNFTTDGGIVASVAAKGGTDIASWPVGDSSATGLHAPPNPNSGDWYDLSYLCFTMGGGGVG
jgi:hypothetical protein